jgi:hypothetical protein
MTNIVVQLQRNLLIVLQYRGIIPRFAGIHRRGVDMSRIGRVERDFWLGEMVLVLADRLIY